MARSSAPKRGTTAWALSIAPSTTVFWGARPTIFRLALEWRKDTPGKKNCVFSRMLSKAASSKVSILSEDVDVFSERLRSEKGKDTWLVGGAELVATFLDSGQVDEFIIHVIPKMIGEDIPLV